MLARQMENLETLMRWTAAHVASVVLGDEAVLTDRAFVEGFDLADLRFDPQAWAERWRRAGGPGGRVRLGLLSARPLPCRARGSPLRAAAPSAAGRGAGRRRCRRTGRRRAGARRNDRLRKLP